ncbi:MAG: DNA translocase FtsK 4TM domain-containing protein [Chitinophagaceae bacterium]
MLLKDVPVKRLVGLFALLAGLYLVLACAFYFKTWQNDQTALYQPSITSDWFRFSSALFSHPMGEAGARLAHLFVFKSFGIAAFLPALFLMAWGWQRLRQKIWFRPLRTFFFVTLITLFSSLALAHAGFLAHAELPWGGMMPRFYVDQMNYAIGTALVSLILGGFSLIALIYGLVVMPKPTIRWQFPTLRNPFNQWQGKLTTALQANEPEIVPETPAEVITLPVEPTPVVESTAVGTTVPDDFFEIKNEVETETNEGGETETVTETETEAEAVGETVGVGVTETETDGLSFEVHAAATLPEDEPVAQKTVAGDEPYDPSLDLRNYKFPTLNLLDQRSQSDITIDKNELENNKNQIINTLKSFGIAIAKISATVGPTVTLYEIVPAEGVRISKIRNLEDDIALSLSALGIRIIAPIPGKGTIGIEVPNLKKQFVSMRTLIASDKFVHNDHSLPIALGKRIDNENYIVDLAKMPHLLMAGATGQGKSVGINTILVSLLYKKHPSQLKFVMVDPKKVELSVYRLIEKHFLAKLPNEEEAIITDTKKVINTLNALCIEMDNRYDLLKDAGVRNIREYNEKFIQRRLLPTKGHKYLPFIVLVVDEFADLIMTAGKEVELPIARIAQLARAVGIHCIIATQRPSVNVITGTIKANFPARVAFKVSAKVDSRTILDAGGAEQLIGQGDMLILNGSELVRLQCAFVDTPEVERIVEFIGKQQGYPGAFELPEYEGSDGGDLGGGSSKSLKEVDAMFEQCARLVVTSNSGSTSNLQRRFNLGYNRAGRIMDQLEAAGIVGPGTGGKPREVMVHTEAELDELLRGILNR